jgi:hypothetical protein
MSHLGKLACGLAAFAAVVIGGPRGAHAQPIRTFVALTGNDSNPCTFALPCKSAQHAHDVAAAGGELRMLDPGSYGLLTINKAISILGDGHGGVAAQGNSIAISINAGASDKVNLRDLVIEGFGSALAGIRITSAGLVDVQDCLIRNFNGAGISSAVFGPSKLSVSHTHISGNASTAIIVAPSGAGVGNVTAFIDHVTMTDNGDGFYAFGNFASGGAINVEISDSVASNSGTGFNSESDGVPTVVFVRNSSTAHNNIGLLANRANATLRVTRSTVTDNQTGFSIASGGALVSYGDNNVDGNTTNGSPSSTIGYH